MVVTFAISHLFVVVAVEVQGIVPDQTLVPLGVPPLSVSMVTVAVFGPVAVLLTNRKTLERKMSWSGVLKD